MDKATLLEKIKKGDLAPKGRPGAKHVREAMATLGVLDSIKDLDPKVAHAARRELSEVVVEYRRAHRVARFKRRKHTRG